MTIASLFGRSPFTPLQSHIQQVSNCVELLPSLFQALKQGDQSLVLKVAGKISELEHQADQIKHDIRNHLPKGLFLAIDRGQLLEIVEIQDKIADRVEDAAVLAAIKQLPWLNCLDQYFWSFLEKNMQAFQKTRLIVEDLHELVEFSFGGVEAEKIRNLVSDVAYLEHEADLIQRPLLAAFFSEESTMSYSTFHLWQQIFQAVGAVSNLSENLAFRIRMTLEAKG